MNTIRGSTIKLALGAALVVLLAGLGASTALADTITGTYFNVDLTQNGSNVDVVVTANPGYSLKTGDGNDINFNFAVGSGQIINLASDDPTETGLVFSLTTNNQVDGLGDFVSTIFGIGCPNPPGACTMPSNMASVGSYDFTVTGVTVADLETLNASGYSWAAHICTLSNTSCSDPTFFAGDTQPVPEPATLALMGTGLVMLGGKLRRRLGKK